MINRVVLGGVYSFPYGEAASSRIRNIALGFKRHISDVSIISMYHDDQSGSFNNQGTWESDGIILTYKCIAPSFKETSSLLQRGFSRASYLRKYNRLVNNIVQNLRGDHQELLFLYGRSYLFLSSLLKELRRLRLKTKIVFDVVEPPRTKESITEYLSHPFAWDSSLVFKNLLKEFHCCTFISHTLKDQYSHLTKSYQVIPSIVYNHSLPPHKAEISHLKLGYIGSLIDKDYPQLIYDVCAHLYDKGCYFELSIIGRHEYYKEGRLFSRKLNESRFSRQVLFYNNPSEEQKIAIIGSVDYVFCFKKPEMVQYYTFPTRITEMLGLGKVLIINDYGDYRKYFENGKNSIMIEPENIAKGVDAIIQSTDILSYNSIRDNGLSLLDQTFSSPYQCKMLLDKVAK